MPRLRFLPVLLLLAACGDKEEDDTGSVPDVAPTPGRTQACLEGPFESPWTGKSSDFAVDIEAVVEEDGLTGAALDTVLDCERSPDRVLRLTDGEGHTWRLGYGVLDADGTPVTPPLDVVAGQAVTLHYRGILDFGSANGFSLADAAGLVAEVEVGTWGTTLDDIARVSVRPGAVVSKVDSGCGPVTTRTLAFAADDAFEGTPYEEGTLTVDGQPTRAIAVRQNSYEDEILCTDLADSTMWAVFR